MRVFLVYVRDMNFARLVPESLRRKLSPNSDKNWVMGFPPLGILMLSSCPKKAGHEVRLFDTAPLYGYGSAEQRMGRPDSANRRRYGANESASRSEQLA